ncbi:M48 family metalloprotease [Megalodesulfovibrio paquesii]
MDMFEAQEEARRQTGSLVFYFVLAMGVVALAVAVATLLGCLVFWPSLLTDPQQRPLLPWVLGGGAGLICGGIACSSWRATRRLRRGGGETVARMLGGRRIPLHTTAPLERRLLNVVAEMAAACGAPPPGVWVLDREQGLNAFAAGTSIEWAVMGITRGAMERLSRDELQALAGHEMSHVLHGDMQLHTRLLGVVHGLMALSLLGRTLLAASRPSPRQESAPDENQVVLPLAFLGVLLMVPGWLGWALGGMIQAAVCRQQEYLADAFAVQCTRAPGALSSLLQRLGGQPGAGRLRSPLAASVPYIFFHAGPPRLFERLLASHPTLEERIQRIDPQWDGVFPDLPADVDALLLELEHLPGENGRQLAERIRPMLRRHGHGDPP